MWTFYVLQFAECLPECQVSGEDLVRRWNRVWRGSAVRFVLVVQALYGLKSTGAAWRLTLLQSYSVRT